MQLLPPDPLRYFARAMVKAELPFILAIAPALVFPSPGQLWVLAVPILLGICSKVATGRVLPPTPMNTALGVLAVMVAVSLYVTFDVLFSLGKVTGVVLGMLLFWSIVRWTHDARRLTLVVAAFLLCGAALGAAGPLGVRAVGKVQPLAFKAAELPIAIRGLPGAQEGFNPNPVAGCLLLFIPLQTLLLARVPRRWLSPIVPNRFIGAGAVILQVAMLAVTTGSLLLMQSRGALFGLAVAGAAFLIWSSRVVRLLAVGAAGAGLVAALVLGPVSLAETGLHLAGPGVQRELSTRVKYWASAMPLIREFPATGIGMNTFRRVMPERYPAFPPRHPEVPHAHNHLLQAAVDLGVPGLTAYLALWMLAGGLLIRVYRRAENLVFRTLASGLGAGLVGHFVFNMGDAIPLGAKVGALLWIALAMAVSLHTVALTRPAALRP